MKSFSFRFFVGTTSICVALFWIFFLGWPKALHDVIGKDSYARTMAVICAASFVLVTLASRWDHAETLFGEKRVSRVMFAGMTVTFLVPLVTGNVPDASLPMTLFVLLVIGSMVGTALLGVLYSLQIGLLKT